MVFLCVFVALLLVYVALVAFAPDTRKLSRVGLVLRNALLVLGVALNWQAFLGTPPFRPLLIIGALFCGQLLYAVAVLATRLSIREALRAAIPSPSVALSSAQRPLLLLQYCFFATYEEFLWRATAQRFLGDIFANSVIAILMTACLFTILHQKMFTHNLERIEFLVFSLLLGLMYHLTASLLFVVLVHLIRDVNIKFGAPLEERDRPGESPDLVPTQRAERQPAAGDVTRHRE